MAWIGSLGVECRPPVPVLGFGRGHQIDTNHYLDTCERLVRDRGGEVLTGTETRTLVTEDGVVKGAECVLPDGSVRRIDAAWTLLATGGFQGDPVLRAEHIHDQARAIALRANPHSRGGGLALGLAAGAAFGKKDAGFYGHLMPAGVSLSDPARFVDLALYYSEHALLFDLTGERFVDETVGDHLTAMALLERPGPRGCWSPTRGCTGVDLGLVRGGDPGRGQVPVVPPRRCPSAVAESLEEFAWMPEEWGIRAPGSGTASRSSTPSCAGRRDGPRTTARPAAARRAALLRDRGRPAITFAFGGLLIDAEAHALSADGRRTVPGLLVAGADAGGLYRRAYAGGLAPALVFGLAAARTALGPDGETHSDKSGAAVLPDRHPRV